MNSFANNSSNASSSAAPISNDLEQISRLLPIRPSQKLLELGCGRAETTQLLARNYPDLQIIATEVDSVQHARNTEKQPLPNVTFLLGGAEKIDLPDKSVNYVLMLKSLHHVPINQMSTAINEIARILVPDGLAYISEPVYSGQFNEILRLFHDEKIVRQAACDAIDHAIDTGTFEMVQEIFFDTKLAFDGFDEFESKVIGVTHTDFQIDQKLMEKIKKAFSLHAGGLHHYAEFRLPLRVNLLRPA